MRPPTRTVTAGSAKVPSRCGVTAYSYAVRELVRPLTQAIVWFVPRSSTRAQSSGGMDGRETPETPSTVITQATVSPTGMRVDATTERTATWAAATDAVSEDERRHGERERAGARGADHQSFSFGVSIPRPLIWRARAWRSPSWSALRMRSASARDIAPPPCAPRLSCGAAGPPAALGAGCGGGLAGFDAPPPPPPPPPAPGVGGVGASCGFGFSSFGRSLRSVSS